MSDQSVLFVTGLLLAKLLIFGCQGVSTAATAADDPAPRVNQFVQHPRVAQPERGISWPTGQALPVFATPAPTLDAIKVQSLSRDEQITFSAMQGIVNKTRPRLYLLDERSNEGTLTWAQTIGLDSIELYERLQRFDLLAKYAGELAGVVLYDPSVSPHYHNLAGTVAGIKRAIPVSKDVYAELTEHGIELPVVADLTGLAYTTPIEVYTHLYERYWPEAEHRLIVNARPTRRGDYHHTRDVAAAVGAAVVWLDPREPEERALLSRFFADMEAGNAIALGWYSTERSGITTASAFGIGTIPSDFFVSSTVYAGTDHTIHIPPVPPLPALKNKAYIAIYISDGDNIQYVQHAMRRIWDHAEDDRGQVALNWTIAPGLVDIGPALMNYYYRTATPKDAFVTGPSGMGYLIPFNTLEEDGAPVGDVATDPARMAGYTRLTETYLQRSGLRVSTIWDNASPMQRAAYEANARNLYGATVQNFRDVPSVAPSVENGRLYFEKLEIPYAGTYEHVNRSITGKLERWDRSGPLFLSYQMSVWQSMRPGRIVELYRALQQRYPGEVEFVRADHYFNLHNQAKGLPFNLSMLAGVRATASDDSQDASNVLDGTPRSLWAAAGEGAAWIELDFGRAYEVNRYLVRHAGQAGLDPSLNTRGYRVLASTDGQAWEPVDAQRGNEADVTDIDLDPVRARFIRVVIDDPGAGETARIAEIEVYGRQ